MNQFDEQEYTKRFDLALWAKIFGTVKIFKREFAIMITTMILLAVCDAVFPLLARFAIDSFIMDQTLDGFPQFVAGYVGLLIFQVFTVFLFIRNSGRLESNIVYHIRQKGFHKLQELSFSYFDKTPVGWIMARMTSDAQKIGDVVAWSTIDIIWGSVLIVVVVINMLILHTKLALITISVFPVLVGVSILFQMMMLKSFREVRKINSKITGAYNEGINGARTTKTLVRESKNFDEFQDLTSSMRNASVRAAVYSSIYLPIVLSLGSVGVALVLWRGGVDMQNSLISFGTYSVFISYAMQMFEPVQQMARVFAEFQSAQASAERTLSLLDTPADITDTPEAIARYGDALHPIPDNWPTIHGGVEFRHVDFSYKTGEKVLENFNLHIAPGEKIALVGETGSGKSTIVNLVCRFYEPTAGTVLIDGVDYKSYSQIWLQSNLGYVLQSPQLFSGTVRDNIRYGKLDATEEEIIAAAQTVNAYEFIMKLEKGFDTEVGEGGNRLSAGQKQLISFARAIIGNPKLFVLDEATSSIDTETEQIIQHAVDQTLSGRTSFIVAHRLSTIRSCDRILVIKDGGILESGTHKSLLKQRGYYYNLYTNQFKEDAEQKLLS